MTSALYTTYDLGAFVHMTSAGRFMHMILLLYTYDLAWRAWSLGGRGCLAWLFGGFVPVTEIIYVQFATIRRQFSTSPQVLDIDNRTHPTKVRDLAPTVRPLRNTDTPPRVPPPSKKGRV